MSVEYFLDTNIFVYLFDETDDYKRGRAEHLVRQALAIETGCVGYQVVQETLNVITVKTQCNTGPSATDARPRPDPSLASQPDPDALSTGP